MLVQARSLHLVNPIKGVAPAHLDLIACTYRSARTKHVPVAQQKEVAPVSDINNIAAPGLPVRGTAPVSEVGVGVTKRVARPSELHRYCTTGAKFAVANGDLGRHVQVQTTLMTDAATGIPPSAYARRT